MESNQLLLDRPLPLSSLLLLWTLMVMMMITMRMTLKITKDNDHELDKDLDNERKPSERRETIVRLGCQ